MMRRILFLAIILAVLLISPVLAQTFEENYDTEFNKLKDTRNYIYRDGNTIQWQIMNYNPDFEYYIRIYTMGHRSIIKEWKINKPTGELQFIYPGLSKVHINLQKWIPEGKDIEYCKSIPCKIGENLDIITISPASKIEETDFYTQMIRHWTRNIKDTITGASWQSTINIDKMVR